MAIKISELKKLNAAQCFNGRDQGVCERIVLFLKKNKDNAFTVKEITEKLNNGLMERERAFTKKSVYRFAVELARKKGSHIHRKGSYYWCEEKDVER